MFHLGVFIHTGEYCFSLSYCQFKAQGFDSIIIILLGVSQTPVWNI